jgi:hypothetical protein
MRTRFYIPIFFLAFLIGACGPASSVSSTSTISSGIEGYVTEGPMCPGPVAIGDNNCPDKPYQANFTLVDENNKVITHFKTDPSGTFKITIAPGTYILHPESEAVLPHAADQTVIVTPDHFTQVTVVYDTGMR